MGGRRDEQSGHPGSAHALTDPAAGSRERAIARWSTGHLAVEFPLRQVRAGVAERFDESDGV